MPFNAGPDLLAAPSPTWWQALHFLKTFSPSAANSASNAAATTSGSAGASSTAATSTTGSAAASSAPSSSGVTSSTNARIVISTLSLQSDTHPSVNTVYSVRARSSMMNPPAFGISTSRNVSFDNSKSSSIKSFEYRI